MDGEIARHPGEGLNAIRDAIAEVGPEESMEIIGDAGGQVVGFRILGNLQGWIKEAIKSWLTKYCRVAQAAETSVPAEPSGSAGRYSGRYADGQKAYRTNVPRDPATNVPSPLDEAVGPHSRLQIDAKDPGRIYPSTEFNSSGNPLRRIDFAGRLGEILPHQHIYNAATKGFGSKQPLN